MRQIFVVGAMAAGAATGLSAQTHPDVSGTWLVDAAKSDPAPQAVGRGVETRTRWSS